MRHLPVIGLILWVSASAIAVAVETPIPQDTVKMEKRRRDRLEWNRRTIQGAYDKVGKRDPRWDADARKAMDLAARMFSEQIDPKITFQDVFPPAKAAVASGCDDPMLVYLDNRMIFGPDRPAASVMIKRIKEAARALAASRYPGFRRSIALRMAGESMLSVKEPGSDVKKEAERFFDDALVLIKDSVAQDERNEFWEDRWLENLIGLVRGYRTLGVDPVVAYKRVDAPLAKLAEVKVLRLLLRGEFWMNYAWESRGTALAQDVSKEAFNTMGKRMEVAEEAFNEAWQARPGTAKAATQLIDVDRATGGDRANMELWFDRAMKADGDNYVACLAKLIWLNPKWHGNFDDMLAFGRACRDTKNWRTGITLLGAESHLNYAMLLLFKDPKEQAKYLARPEVWSDIQSIYDESLKHFPDDAVVRSKYAMIAYWSSHLPEAGEQFKAVGDRLTMWSGDHVTLASMIQASDYCVKVASGKKPMLVPAGWVRITAKNNDGKWAYSVPTDPERKQEPGLLGAKARNVWTCTAGGITYTIRVQPIPPAARSDNPQMVLNSARAAVVKERSGTPRNVRPAQLAGNLANEYLIDAPALKPKVVRVRMGIIGNRLYELSVTGDEKDAAGDDATTFLDSFRFE